MKVLKKSKVENKIEVINYFSKFGREGTLKKFNITKHELEYINRVIINFNLKEIEEFQIKEGGRFNSEFFLLKEDFDKRKKERELKERNKKVNIKRLMLNYNESINLFCYLLDFKYPSNKNKKTIDSLRVFLDCLYYFIEEEKKVKGL